MSQLYPNIPSEKEKEIEFLVEHYSAFIVTGILPRTNKRFRKHYESTVDGFLTTMSINVWNGSIWGIRKDNGKRQRIKRIIN